MVYGVIMMVMTMKKKTTWCENRVVFVKRDTHDLFGNESVTVDCATPERNKQQHEATKIQ